MYIAYVGEDDCIVCKVEDEAEAIRVYFTEGGREIMDYDRKEINESAVCLSADIRAD